MAAQLPTLPGMVDGIVRRDLLGWTLQCAECAATETVTLLVQATIRFHRPWSDGTNPRLCRACRLARGCHCTSCDEERRGTLTVHAELRAVTPTTPERKS